MARTKSQTVPKLRRQSGKGKLPDRAFVELSGRRVYCGAWGSAESRQRYAKAIVEWEAASRHGPAPTDALTVVELLARFWRHAESYYVDAGGRPTSSICLYQMALRPVKRLYGNTPAADFGPKALRTVRQEMIEKCWSRGVVNKMVNLVRSVWKWGVAEELIDVGVHVALTTVAPLKRGRTEAPETQPVRPVPGPHVDAVLPLVSRQVAAMIQLQRLTGMRPGEVVRLRPCDIDRTGDVWTARFSDHKTDSLVNTP